jgi:ATPase family associated with various cellular activities (AAA)/AAA lid domain
MSYGAKVATLSAQLVDAVTSILTPKMEDAVSLAGNLDYFEDERPFVNWLHEKAEDDDNFVSVVVSTAVVSDLLRMIKGSILADDSVEPDELRLAMDLLSDVIHRYAWLDNYKRFDPLVDPSEVVDLLSAWEKDSGWLGGNYKDGATFDPFAHLLMLACMIKGDASLHDTFTQVSLLVAKMILSAGGTDSEEQKFLDALKEYRNNERGIINAVIEALKKNSSGSSGPVTRGNPADITVDTMTPAKALENSLKELEALVGVPEVKAEIKKLTNFLRVRQQRLAAGLPLPSQSLHFVFTGNPGTGKTTVARIVSRILYGFEILGTPTLVEADRSMLVGGYVGQTAIKTSEIIEKSINGILFIDEAYTLAKEGGNDFGQEAIDTILKKMEDLRDRLVVIVAGYPRQMKEFLSTNPGLESRFTRFIHFDDYHVADLCNIYERMCMANSYSLTQQARANLAILFNRGYAKKDEKFGNARFVRNVYEKTLGNHADRLANIDGTITTEMLSTIEAADLPFGMVVGLSGPFEAADSKWNATCPGCEKVFAVGLALIGNRVNCKCGAKFRCPWWNLRPETIPTLSGYKTYERPIDLVGYDAVVPPKEPQSPPA